MTTGAAQIRLTGTTSAGSSIDTTLSGEGGLVVDCNTPYSVSLQRAAVFAAPRGPARRLVVENSSKTRGGATPAATAAAADAEDARAVQLAGDMDVVVRIANRDGAMESNCVMAAPGATPFVCHAFSGPDDVRLPPPRAAASLIVTGTLDRAGAAAVPVTSPDSDLPTAAAPNDSDEREAAAVRETQGGAGARRRIGDKLTVSLTAKY